MNNIKLEYLLRFVLGKTNSEIPQYRQALKNPKTAVTNPHWRGMIADVLVKLLDLNLNEPIIWNKIRTMKEDFELDEALGADPMKQKMQQQASQIRQQKDQVRMQVQQAKAKAELSKIKQKGQAEIQKVSEAISYGRARYFMNKHLNDLQIARQRGDVEGLKRHKEKVAEFKRALYAAPNNPDRIKA